MILLSMDTSEPRGGIAVRMDGTCVAKGVHESDEEYSSWLLPAVENVLKASGLRQSDLEFYAVCTGPGSFTGVRLGLCTVKAWAEVYRKPIVGVSRLEAIASLADRDGLVAATYNAHRGQAFAALFERVGGSLLAEAEEMVTAPDDFLNLVKRQAQGRAVQWLSLDPDLFTGLPGWTESADGNAMLRADSAGLANAIGVIAEGRAARQDFTDALELDANYVRRSDAEIFWKGPAHRVG
jgi:tRNA threonylcarbamoyladenosine biosynthesis protein TsaB